MTGSWISIFSRPGQISNRQTSGESASLSQYLGCNTVFDMRHISSPEDRITSIKHCAPRISSKMATIDEFVLKNIGLWWRYGISRYCDEWKYIIIGRIFESEIILIPPSLKISESSSNGSYRNTDEVWWRYRISRSCDEWENIHIQPLVKESPYWAFRAKHFRYFRCRLVDNNFDRVYWLNEKQ